MWHGHLAHEPTRAGRPCHFDWGAADGTRTRNTQLGKLIRYQLRHSRLKIDVVLGDLNPEPSGCPHLTPCQYTRFEGKSQGEIKDMK